MVPERLYRFLAEKLRSLGRVFVGINNERRRELVANEATEALVAAPLPEMIGQLGLAVAEANAKMAENTGPNRTVFAINKAEIELKIAVSLSKDTTFGVEVGGQISAFSVNASYARTYGFKEEASSRILIHLEAKPAPTPA